MNTFTSAAAHWNESKENPGRKALEKTSSNAVSKLMLYTLKELKLISIQYSTF